MITLDDVTLTYPDGDGRVTALDRVGLTGRPGTVTGITGPSGSGKSSLLAVAATLVAPDAGRVVIDGVDAVGLSAAEASRLRRTRIGIMFQQANLLPSLTALEQVQVMNELGEAGSRGRRGAVREQARELLAAVGLAGLEGRRPHQLSGGQRQRVNLARALVNQPAVLLVDEPTSALDSVAGAAVVELIVRLTAERGTATLLVTHDLEHLPQLDEAVQLVDGRVSTPAAA
ncbi:ABC transporter ATP-binding protein [Nakamurella multipartita]|uniref:ABC transporter related n=1 Tax=Nakamurella multipartita (strain ATCC 700099 / DSM 44233 / CIP 104796 / JCM 9543 / NBRC 105858 / Y-104) TaxID=479431 RepID=C8X6Y4_NAKMY|nr:ABC transporter ATP-binding protein [Nakamurella multipartita]ACV80882.1 ABC transporter related [Nakamurella multipartita DSM 44233]